MARGAAGKRSTAGSGGGSRILRIIAGKWRGRKLQFPDLEGIRPTPDRVRETLFNWLAPHIHEARCLDLFAGSGAVGLEALSRGAREVVMVEREARAVSYLRDTGRLLGSEGLTVNQGDALRYLQGPATPFDIVFLDPPFRQNLLVTCLQGLMADNWLSAGALIYIEVEKELGELELPGGWELLKHKISGQVAYHLIQTP
ncbi:MAG: 16S rRNA (guanine(966)-N(2))-methyltransferase RsmD [Gammaproteobacteria bacterium]|nr:16S rRNA (guanine(966)-N(2))-methyltransferase RsmD [Gammaproteobacteria bacterium]